VRLALILLLLLPSVTSSSAAVPPTPITVLAHRCNGGPFTENTQAACVAAVAAGADWLEMDARWPETGPAVILHDKDLGVFGAPEVRVADVSMAQASQHVSPEHNTITLLSQMRDVVLISGVQLDLELKTRPTTRQWFELDAVLAPIKGRTVISSFDRTAVAAATARGYTTALISFDDVTDPPPGISLVAQKASTIDAKHVAALRWSGVRTWCFRCDTPASWKAMRQAGVTGLITDHPAAAQAWAAGRR
jgi:glycerophosphoryl diester phosphodiesterase